jgi:hypothetical protein
MCTQVCETAGYSKEMDKFMNALLYGHLKGWIQKIIPESYILQIQSCCTHF